LKSNVSDYLELAYCIYRDACAQCPADVSDLRDLKTIRSRVEHEGVSFLTITLPTFCKSVERCLTVGYIDPTWFRGFPLHGAIPVFLQGMLGRVFDRENGRIYDESTIDYCDHAAYLDSLRQICLAFKKVELECTPSRVSQVIANFVEIERAFGVSSVPTEDVSKFLDTSSMLWDNLIFGLYRNEFIPSHGPGATADRISGNRKYAWRRWHERLDNYFPLYHNAFSISAMGSEEVEVVSLVPEVDEQPVRVVTVPKTLKGPRVIAIEPCCMQYAQQTVRNVLYDAIERYDLTAGHINFRDQTINQVLAVSSSIDGQLATIDLSDASDRVPRDLALAMFRADPDLLGLIDACRSRYAELPDGTVIGPLRKFASMGSALCFPVEAMYFYTICVMALLESRNLSLTNSNLKLVGEWIHVYGDDIIVPTDDAGTVLDYLRKYNCKVNSAKTFVSGSFRESCGVDAYSGRQVTPVYVRSPRPKNRQLASNIISWSETANLFFNKGYVETAEHMHTACEQILKFYPFVSGDGSGLGRSYPVGLNQPLLKRFNREFQRLEVKAWLPTPVYSTDRLEGYAALQKCLLSSEKLNANQNDLFTLDDDFVAHKLWSQDYDIRAIDKHHLERTARHGAVSLKLRWVPAT
jgi:hypothetical protein